MAEKKVLEPGPDHPITIEPHRGRVVVLAGDTVLADTSAALTLRESTYPAVLYIPRADTKVENLARTEQSTYCPYKGEAAYFSVPALGVRGENSVWTYETPYPAVAEIKEHVAFYPDRVTISES
ncbi:MULTISPECIES: DUF427 domain-containing protein [unclassified Crossiella]|uniref:DUF427 domain-containing protein n=1 Tax=unclassified Crossiella TaxID=2620835 RepID=UPI001FFF2A2B|nr:MULTISPECIES: DUF427 domain-containing protein [unclassified Crossiella]MCK2241459.1 DUF427 domain-containing protein [Crossiella sp. S99.2]MCK2255669.1 DUF427 domain-containing protein [Crossiella sp. S99.1]